MHALVIAGGSVRAAYANGVLAAWEDADWDPFDAVYGTSAGAALAARWAGGQARRAIRTWPYVQDRRILSWSRYLLRRGPLMDHDALFDIVYEEEHPLDIEAIQEAPYPVVVPVTDVDAVEFEYKDVREGQVTDWLRAAGRMPIGCGPPVTIDGRRWADGGLFDALPVARAIEDGADEVTLLLNRPPEPRTQEPRIVSWLVDRRFPGLGELVEQHHADWNSSLRLAQDPPDGVEGHVVAPRGGLPVGRLSRDLEDIRTVIDRGQARGRDVLRERGIDPGPPRSAELTSEAPKSAEAGGA